MTEKVDGQHSTGATAQASLATSSRKDEEGIGPFQNVPLPSVADEEEPHIMDPKTLLECCRCARSFNLAHGLPDRARLPVRNGTVGVDHSRV